jgi:hypothetical protein
VRLHAVLALCLVAAGCGNETVVRLTVYNGEMMPAPARLRLTLVGSGVTAAPRVIAPVSLPGVVVIRALPSSTPTLCILVEALDAGNAVVGEGVATVPLVAHGTARADLTLAPPGTVAGGDIATPPPPPDLAGSDAGIILCPVGALFCDDFETGNLNKWPTFSVRYDMASLDVQTAIVRHGTYALHAAASGASSLNNIAEVEYVFSPTPPPLAIRANIYAPLQLYNYTMVMALYDNTTKGFAVGGDNTGAGMWVMTEDQAGSPDHYTDMVPASGGQWHCVELVIDGAGMVSMHVDGHQLVAPFPRVSLVQYSSFIVGIERTVLNDTNVFVDDVAMSRSRLYCP